jgi:hypothetical protein
MSGTDSIGANDNHEDPITDEELAATEFEPADVAFCPKAWNNFVPAAYTVMVIAKALLNKNKCEMVEMVRALKEDDSREEVVMAMLHDTIDAAKTFKRYAKICNASWSRLMIAATVIKLETAAGRDEAS